MFPYVRLAGSTSTPGAFRAEIVTSFVLSGIEAFQWPVSFVVIVRTSRRS